MLGTARSLIGIQGRLNVRGAGIVRCGSYRRALKRSLHHGTLRKPPTALLCPVVSSNNHQRRARAPLSTTGQVGKVVTGRKLPDTGDIVHDRFLLCVEKGDASGAMAHFAFIACEGGPLMTLRRRQLLVLLCEKGMIKEASELLTSATTSPTFNSQDLSTIASFLYVMCGCLRHGDVDRALEHFRQASERGISLDLPLCESLATALFIKGLQGGSTEMAAWNVLDYIRQRGMEHRPEVFDHALIYATACGDLSFALRICQYVDEEGVCCDSDVRGALCRSVAMATKKLPDIADVTSNGGEREDWKVEGTNATVEELWALDSLLQSWLDTEIEIGEDFVDEDGDEDSDEDEEFEMDVLDGDEDRVVSNADRFADIVDYDGSDGSVEGDDSAHGNDEDTSGGGEQGTSEASTTTDFGGDEFCGDLMDQMSKLHPDQENPSFRPEDELGTLPTDLRRPGGMQAGGGDKSRRSVYADLVMPYGDPHGEGEQGIMSIPVKISVEEKNDDDDDDDDDDDGAV